ncbi:CHRD domain-containing protein [Streptomyces sp. NPDC051907]|uniref:CHRD domain-containing protein n=1 Tax=Streptomyces sp. NPDC051907 TaxID=3155284 RepID=UPI003435A68C
MKRTKAIRAGATACAAAAVVALTALPASATDGGGGGASSGTAQALFVASLRGANEVPAPGGPAVGDHDAAALEFVRVKGDRVSVAVKWRGADKPTALHIHQGPKGANGGVKVDFTSVLAQGERADKGWSGTGWSGTATGTVEVADKAFLAAFQQDPNAFYANLHTAQFPGGAVRGQFHRVTGASSSPSSSSFADVLDSFQASVIRGRQIYECKKGQDGKLSFQQRDVRAVLGRGVAHSFTAPNSGTPQWIAPDRSAVTGALISRTPNGAENIPELNIKATPSGAKKGLFAHTQEIFRLNTVGGVAPAGTCAEGAVVGVPYGADYVFVQK